MELGVKVNVFCLWLQKNNGGWGSITILRGKFQKCPVKLFSSEFSVWWFGEKSGFPWSGCYVVGVKVFDKSLPRLETLQSTPPFFQLYFLKRLILGEKCQNTFILP